MNSISNNIYLFHIKETEIFKCFQWKCTRFKSFLPIVLIVPLFIMVFGSSSKISCYRIWDMRDQFCQHPKSIRVFCFSKKKKKLVSFYFYLYNIMCVRDIWIPTPLPYLDVAKRMGRVSQSGIRVNRVAGQHMSFLNGSIGSGRPIFFKRVFLFFQFQKKKKWQPV